MRRLVVLTIVAVVLGPFAACTGSAPEILYPDSQLSLVRDPTTGELAEVLRLYVAVRDPDGADDPARIFLVHDEAGLFWELAREDWVAFEYAGDQWYGVPDVRMPDGESLPRGPYRLIVEDSSLERTESTVLLSSEPADRASRFPSLAFDGESVEVSYSEPVNLRVYGRSGQLVVNTVVRAGAVPRDVEGQIPRETGVTAFVSTIGEGHRLEAGPFAIPR